MRCDECLPLLEEYYDGELTAPAVDLLNAHLAGCAACGAVADKLRVEQEIYSRYDRDIDVGPKLWSGIQERIREQQADKNPARAGLREWLAGIFSGPRLSPAFAVMLVILAVVATVIVTRNFNREQQKPSSETASTENSNGATTDRAIPPPQSTPDAAQQHTPPGVADARPAPGNPATVATSRIKRKTAPGPEELVRQAEEKYRQAIAILSRDVNRRRPEMDTQMLARFDLAIGAIDRTIAETRQAVQQQQGDPVALQYMLAAYSRKVELLREMANF